VGRKKQVHRRDTKNAPRTKSAEDKEKNYNLGKKTEDTYYTNFPGQKADETIKELMPNKMTDREGSR